MLERLKPPARGRLEVADELCPGLVFRVTDRGVRTLSAIYRVSGEGGVSAGGRVIAGKQHRITLGRFPAIKLTHARDRAREIVATAKVGRDPRRVTAEIVTARQANTFAAVLARHISQDASLTISSWRNVDRVLRLHAVPKFGDLPIAEIRRADVHGLLDELVAAGKVGTAREVRKHLSKLFNWAADRELIPSNPIYALKRTDLIPRTEAGRALTDIELKAVWLAAEEMRYPFGVLFQLLILTGQRRSEWAEAKRSEVNEDFTALELSRERFKGRRAHIVPVVGEAGVILGRLPVWAGIQDYYLFSTQAGHVPVAGFSQAKVKLDELALAHLRKLVGNARATLKHYRVHDFRVTCETRLAHLGFAQDVRDSVLGHAKPGLQRTYNKYDYMDEKRAALEAYGRHIMEIVR
jgi:integrase